jgi:hypothetical protein
MDYPIEPLFQTVNLKSIDPTLMSQTVNGRTQTRKIASQYWEFSAKYPPMTQTDFMPVYAYCLKQRGGHGTFSVKIPVLGDIDPSRGVSGDMMVIGSVNAGNTTIPTTGLTGHLQAGDMVKFPHDKIYMIVDTTIDEFDNIASIDIVPNLRIDLNDNDSITYNDIHMKVRLKNDIQSFSIINCSLFTYEVDFIEAL